MKRILLAIAAIAAVATTAVWFAAEESYVTTVKATVGTSLNVNVHGSQNYGLVFGQDIRSGAMRIRINQKAILESNLTGVEFEVGCNDPADLDHSICPNVSFVPSAGLYNLVVGGDEELLLEWVFIAPDCEGAAQKKVNPKTVPCNQDNNWDLEGAVFDDVTARQGSLKELVCNKKTNTFFNLTTGEDTGVVCVVGGDPQPPD